MDFNTTLLREKFIIRDSQNETFDDSLIATSNRIAVNLTDARGITVETIIVRAQNMHLCIRTASQIVRNYERNGPILIRDIPYDWEEAWEKLIDSHERKHNPNKWVAIYGKGALLFKSGKYHPLLDLIEKCDAANPENYDASVRLAEEAFSQMGKDVSIDYESNIGLVAFIEKGQGRCGIILRNSERNSTFNFRLEQTPEYKVSAVQCLNVCAAFLEGMQLAFVIGVSNEKVRLGLITKSSKEGQLAVSARRRLGQLNAEIRTFENTMPVFYRPERPEFGDLVSEAERFASDLFSQAPETDVGDDEYID
ncbi:MAG: tetratricopeptide repeat protein [Bdellovibrionales bacterium]